MKELFTPPSAKELSKNTATPFLFKPKRVLFLDDDETLCKLMRAMVSKFNVELTIVHTIKDAQEVIREEELFDLIMLDVKLSNGSGITVYKDIMVRWPQADVAFLTGWSSDEIREEIESVGPARVYHKNRAMTIEFINALFRQLGFIPFVTE